MDLSLLSKMDCLLQNQNGLSLTRYSNAGVYSDGVSWMRAFPYFYHAKRPWQKVQLKTLQWNHENYLYDKHCSTPHLVKWDLYIPFLHQHPPDEIPDWYQDVHLLFQEAM